MKSSSEHGEIEDLSANIPKLRSYVERIVEAIIASQGDLPYGVHYIAACLKDLLLRKHKDLSVRPHFASYLSSRLPLLTHRLLTATRISPACGEYRVLSVHQSRDPVS